MQTPGRSDVRPGDGHPLMVAAVRLTAPHRGERLLSLHIQSPRTDWVIRRWEWKAGGLTNLRAQDITTTICDRLYVALVGLEGVQEELEGFGRP
jgi:hypothetical protein